MILKLNAGDLLVGKHRDVQGVFILILETPSRLGLADGRILICDRASLKIQRLWIAPTSEYWDLVPGGCVP